MLMTAQHNGDGYPGPVLDAEYEIKHRRQLMTNSPLAITRYPEQGTLKELQYTVLGLAVGVVAVSILQGVLYALRMLFRIDRPMPA